LYPFVSHNGTLINDVIYKEPFSLIFGSESAGLDEKYFKVGTPVTIPQSSEVDSLNLSIAVGVGLFNSSKL
jgi:TrmH family RNA methyltransferase